MYGRAIADWGIFAVDAAIQRLSKTLTTFENDYRLSKSLTTIAFPCAYGRLGAQETWRF